MTGGTGAAIAVTTGASIAATTAATIGIAADALRR